MILDRLQSLFKTKKKVYLPRNWEEKLNKEEIKKIKSLISSSHFETLCLAGMHIATKLSQNSIYYLEDWDLEKAKAESQMAKWIKHLISELEKIKNLSKKEN